MVDYSGIAVDTYKMTGGLFDAYNRYLTDRQNREKTAAEMERAAYRTNSMRQSENAVRDKNPSVADIIAGLIDSEQMEQALEVMKMPAQSWNISRRQPYGLPPGTPSPMMGQLPLNLVRLWNQDMQNHRMQAPPRGGPGRVR